MAASTSGEEPQPKKKRLSLSQKRFAILDEKSIEEAFVPKNTQKATSWATSDFDQWLQEHNKLSDKKCPLDVLLKSDQRSYVTGYACLLVKSRKLMSKTIRPEV